MANVENWPNRPRELVSTASAVLNSIIIKANSIILILCNLSEKIINNTQRTTKSLNILPVDLPVFFFNSLNTVKTS